MFACIKFLLAWMKNLAEIFMQRSSFKTLKKMRQKVANYILLLPLKLIQMRGRSLQVFWMCLSFSSSNLPKSSKLICVVSIAWRETPWAFSLSPKAASCRFWIRSSFWNVYVTGNVKDFTIRFFLACFPTLLAPSMSSSTFLALTVHR